MGHMGNRFEKSRIANQKFNSPRETILISLVQG